ncbi:MAG TPA: efflux RND transporter periplasmic adaptor subunit [Fimbriimonadaceae bacterium]|nr:efflux RND transporter periplasmic adaptor subunit [Fimbriimonadaceae bacterium]HRE93340.1 efflux RND transporter periplasmic adaptor subunit [Fimbriimonadaceae bacterium]
MMNRDRRWVPLVAAVVGAVALAGCRMPSMGGAKPADKGSVHTVSRGDVASEVVESGRLEALKTVEVKSRISGRVARLLVDEGDYVTKGQLIGVIDPQETELQVKQTRAQLRGAQSAVRASDARIQQSRQTALNAIERQRSIIRQLEAENKVQPDLTRNAISTAEASLRSAQQAYDQLVKITQPNSRANTLASVEDAKNQLAQAAAEERRQKELLDLGYVSQRSYESAQLNLRLAATRVETAQATLSRFDEQQILERKQAEERVKQAEAELQRARLGSVQDVAKREQYQQALKALSDAQANLRGIDADIASRAQQAASVDQISVQLQDTERQLAETEIRAPISGVVTKRLVQEGELVAALGSFSAGTPIVRVEDRSGLLVRLEINEIDVARLSQGTTAEITVDSFPGKKFSGMIRKIAPTSVAAGNAAVGQSVVGDPVVKYDVEVLMTQTDPAIKSGMSASCSLKAAERKNVIRVPFAYVAKEKDGRRYVVKEPAAGTKPDPKKPQDKTYVTAGLEGGGFIEIIEGLSGGEKLILPSFSGPQRSGMMSVSSGDDGDGDGGGDN